MTLQRLIFSKLSITYHLLNPNPYEKMKKVEEFYPKAKQEWRAWLATYHSKKDAVWVIFYKKSSPNFNLSWSESVDEALCFGWIDSTKKTLDKECFMQYFSKRKPKSNWSKVNKDKVAKLIEQGLMEDAGYKSIQIAKENGSWNRLDAIENLEIPQDLAQALESQKPATEYFENLSKSAKKSLLYWVASAQKLTTRQKRIAEIVENAWLQTKPKQFRS